MTQATLINLHPNQYSQELHQYPFAINLDRCDESCNTINDFSNKVCVLNKIEDLNLWMLNMIAGTNELKTLKHISSESKCKFDGRKSNSNQKWSNDKYWCQCKSLKKKKKKKKKKTCVRKRLYMKSWFMQLSIW